MNSNNPEDWTNKVVNGTLTSIPTITAINNDKDSNETNTMKNNIDETVISSIPKTGSMVDSNVLIGLGILLTLAGGTFTVLSRK